MVSVPIAKRLGLGSVLGYLLAGVLIGPHVFRFIGDARGDVMSVAEFGVVMMLFLVGLELRPNLLWRLRGPIFGSGTLQVVLTSAVCAVLSSLLPPRHRSSHRGRPHPFRFVHRHRRSISRREGLVEHQGRTDLGRGSVIPRPGRNTDPRRPAFFGSHPSSSERDNPCNHLVSTAVGSGHSRRDHYRRSVLDRPAFHFLALPDSMKSSPQPPYS